MIGHNRVQMTCQDCNKGIDDRVWSSTKIPTNDPESVEMYIRCDKCFIKHIMKTIKESNCHTWAMPIYEMYKFIFGVPEYDTEKMRVLMEAVRAVFDEEKKDG